MRGAIILAGGRSTRMGENKAFVSLMGKSLLSWEVESLSDLVDELMIVAKNKKETKSFKKEVSSKVKVLYDIVAQQGPLAGIYSALKVAKSEYCYVHPIDSPIISPEVVDFLFKRARNREGAVIKLEKGLWEPLHAVYKRDAAVTVAEKALQLGDSSAKILAKKLQVRQLSLDDIRIYDKELASLFNINTKADLAKIESYLRKR